VSERGGSVAGGGLGGDDQDAEGKAQDEITIEEDFDGIISGLSEFDAAEDGDVGGMGVLTHEFERGLAAADLGLDVVRGEDAGGLDVFAHAVAPSGIDAEFHHADRETGGGDEVEDAHEGVGTGSLQAHILANEGTLEVGGHGTNLSS
jgi:hypothetical protein